MGHGDFIWCDLSTFDLGVSTRFYSDLFGWQMADSGEYNLCYAGRTEAAGLYVMPEFFQKINMPSFWMSYIQVDDVNRAIETANKMGGKVELGPEPFGAREDGQIALIRDPQGAGFTVYQGPDFNSRDLRGGHGRMAWNELIISDIAAVQPFYEALFDWKISRIAGSDRFEVHNQADKLISNIEQVPNEIKGDLEYWAIYFAVRNLDTAKRAVEQHGGTIAYDQSSSGTRQIMAADPQGAAFHLIEGRPSGSMASGQNWAGLKWRTLLGLALVFGAIWFSWDWLWSVLFLVWVIPDLFSGVTYFLEPITRQENPALYWLIVLTWLGLSIYLFVELFT